MFELLDHPGNTPVAIHVAVCAAGEVDAWLSVQPTEGLCAGLKAPLRAPGWLRLSAHASVFQEGQHFQHMRCQTRTILLSVA